MVVMVMESAHLMICVSVTEIGKLVIAPKVSRLSIFFTQVNLVDVC